MDREKQRKKYVWLGMALIVLTGLFDALLLKTPIPLKSWINAIGLVAVIYGVFYFLTAVRMRKENVLAESSQTWFWLKFKPGDVVETLEVPRSELRITRVEIANYSCSCPEKNDPFNRHAHILTCPYATRHPQRIALFENENHTVFLNGEKLRPFRSWLDDAGDGSELSILGLTLGTLGIWGMLLIMKLDLTKAWVMITLAGAAALNISGVWAQTHARRLRKNFAYAQARRLALTELEMVGDRSATVTIRGQQLSVEDLIWHVSIDTARGRAYIADYHYPTIGEWKLKN